MRLGFIENLEAEDMIGEAFAEFLQVTFLPTLSTTFRLRRPLRARSIRAMALSKPHRCPGTVLHEVEYQSLRIEAQADIAAVLIDHSDYLTSGWWTDAGLREVLVGLVEPIRISICARPVSALTKQVASHGFCDLAVRKLQERLSIVGDLDPIMMDGEKFIDGRHRLEAYRRAGRETIPTVDIGELLRTNWEAWMNG